MSKKWSDVAASSAFQALSFEEQEEARRQYFEQVIAPRVPEQDVSIARQQFFSDTAPKRAPSLDTQPIDYGDAATDMMGTPATPPAQGLIQRIGQALRPEPKSLLDQPYTPTPEEAQAERDRRLSYGAGPIRPEVLTAADKVRSTRGTQNEFRTNNPTVARVAREMDLRKEESSADIIGRINTQANRDAALQAKAEEFRSLGEWAVDSLSGVAQGFVSLAQLPTNIIAPGSSLAESLRETQKELQAQESDVAKASREVLRRRVESEDGFLGKYFATVKELVTNPTLSVTEALKQIPMFVAVVGGARLGSAVGGAGVAAAGRAAPSVALADAIGGGALTTAARATGATVGGVASNMVMTAGDAAGNTYETLTDSKKTPLSEWQKNPDYQRLLLEKLSSGRTEEQAKSLIDQIQKNAKNPRWFPEDTPGGEEYVAASKQAIEEIATAKARMAALITAPLGVLGFMGAEAAVVNRGLGRAAADAMTLRGAAKLVGKDVGLEQLEEGGTQLGSNVATRTINPNQSLMEGVPEAMATAAVTSTPFGVLGAYSQYKAAQEQGQQADPVADYLARTTPGARDAAPEFISPEQTVRRPTDVGPSPLAPGVANFTPPNSPTKQAGMVDIVVPMPGAPGEEVPTVPGTINPTTEQQFGLDKLRMGGANVGTSGVLGGLAGEGSGAGGGLIGGSMGLAGPGNADAAGPGGGLAGVPGANDRQAVPAGGAAGQQAAGVAPAKIWAGRAGDGYMQPEDAQQALPGLQRKYPDLTWNLQQDADGKFFWSGTTRGGASGAAVTGAAGQGLAGVPGTGVAQQPGAAGAGVVDLGQAGGSQPGRSGGAATVGGASPDEPVFTLKLAPPAPLRAAGQAITLLKTSRGVEVELTDAANLTEQQKVASAMARLVGKTVTYMDYVSGPANKMPNGFVIPGKEQNIYLDSKSDDGALFVMMHEGVHALPQPIREKLVATIKGLTKTGMRADFAKKFGYDINNEFEVDNEIAAFMTQAVSKRQDFWQELRTKMGDGDFVEVAKVILDKLNTFIAGAKSAYGDEFLKRYATDAVAVRDAVSTAYADAMKSRGQQAPAAADAVVASNRQVPEGERPYANAPNSLMGFRKSQPNKPFAEQSYKHVEFVRVTWPDGTSMLEAQRGLNKAHALERARRNWSDAESVIAVPREIAKGEDPTLVSDVDSMMGGGITASNRAADVDKLGMYSELARKLDAGPNQAPVDQWKAYIKGLPQKGVKPDEIEWSGVEDFLELKRAAGQKVTKAEVAEYLKQGGVKVEETVLGVDGTKDYGDLFVDEIGRNEWAVFGENSEGQIGGTFATRADAQRAMQSMLEENKPTKYGKYTLPGGENYREVLLTLPINAATIEEKAKELATAPWEQMSEQAKENVRAIALNKMGVYRSKHWDQPNVLAHIRVNDRTDADGKRVLFVEEIQSDWGQEGKKKGFVDKREPLTLDSLKRRLARHYGMSDPDEASGIAEILIESKDDLSAMRDLLVVDGGFSEGQAQEFIDNFKTGEIRDGVMPGPFVTKTEGWLNLALKRVMVMAAEGGYDKVAFVNGEQSADRYDLSKKVDSIKYFERDGKFNVQVYPKGGRGWTSAGMPRFMDAEQLERNLGKNLSKKIVGGEGETQGPDPSTKYLSGLDLRVGGEGMKTFYDTIVPTALKKLLQKVGGGQMGTVGVQVPPASALDPQRTSLRETIAHPGFDVTPDMREKVATSGLPMFSNRAVNLGSDADANINPPDKIAATGIQFSLRRVEEIDDAPEITMQDLVGETVFPVLADLTAAGYVYMGKELRGGPYYTLLPSNSKAGLIWANDGKGVSSIKNKKAKRGVIGLIIAMKQDSHATNNTVANLIFRAVEDEIQKGSVRSEDIPKLDEMVRGLANRTATVKRMVDGKEVKETKPVFPGYAKFPGFADRSASEKFLRELPFEARGLFFEEMTKGPVQDMGLGAVRKVINDTIEPDLRGLNMGDAVMAIRFDPNEEPVVLGEQSGTPEHDSYRYAVKGKVIGKFKRPISFQNIFLDLMAERAAKGSNITRDYRSLTLRKPEQLITQQIADAVSGEAYKNISSPAEAQAAVAAANIDWKKIDRPTAAGVREFLRTSRVYGRGENTPSFEEAKQLIKDGKLRIFRLAETENWFSLEDRDGKRVMTSVMVSQLGVRQETLFGDMIEVAKANGATHIEIGKTVAPLKKVDAPRRVAPIINELSAMTDNDLANLGIDPADVRRLSNMTKSSEAAQASPTSAVMFSNRVSPADKIKWREITQVKREIGIDRLPSHIVPFANFMETMATKAANGGLTSRDVIKAYTIARSSMNRSAVTTSKVVASGLKLPASFKDEKIRPEGAFGYWLLSPMGQGYLNAAEVGLTNQTAIDDAVKVMSPFGTQNTLGEDLKRAASGDLHTRLPALTAAIVKASKGDNAVEDWQRALDNLYGVREAKKGFLGSLLGFGQLPTFDARQINVNVERESKEDTLRALSSTKAREVVATLTRRMDALSLTMDPKYRPFYQHLAHHAVWDAIGGTETTHEDVVQSMLTASNRAQTDTPEFKRWFGDSKVVDENGEPLVVYHGTNKDITEFKSGLAWFAEDSNLANMFVAGGRRKAGEKWRKGSTVYPTYLMIKNPLDLSDMLVQSEINIVGILERAGLPTDDAYLRKMAQESLMSGWVYVSPSVGDPINYLVNGYLGKDRLYSAIENPQLISRLKSAGYDGIKTKEVMTGGTMRKPTQAESITYAVFEPTQIKSAIGNRGTFDPENPDITASNRAATTKTDPELASIFKDLDGARGLSLIRAQERVDAHPMAETIRQIDKDFLDILERLDDAGLVKINCK